MELAHILTHGADAVDAALTVNRMSLGVFFAISGYHKLFNKARHASVTKTLADDGAPAVPITQWLIPAAEFAGGVALVTGTLSVVAAVGLMIICAGATCLDGLKRIASWQPIDRADWLDDVLYLPEVLYIIALLFVVLGGPGRLSVDALLAALL